MNVSFTISQIAAKGMFAAPAATIATIVHMRPASLRLYARVVAAVIGAYGLVLIATTLFHSLMIRRHRDFDGIFITSPIVIGMSYLYLGSLLYRLKRNAWAVTVALSVVSLLVNGASVLVHSRHGGQILLGAETWTRLSLPVLIGCLLLVSRSAFTVRSDLAGFRQAVRMSIIVLLVTTVYGLAGFTLLDRADFHQEIGVGTALHQIIDQFGLTTRLVSAHTTRARLFLDSLSAISIGAAVYVVLAFFQPIRFRLRSQQKARERAQELLRRYPSDIDDFFKLWPHDKQYFLDKAGEAGLAYHVRSGVALVVGDPFGSPKRFVLLAQAFEDFCFVNDWRPAYVHVGNAHRDLYAKLGYRLQKIGEEAVVDLRACMALQQGKYFRHIRNRFEKLGYTVEIVDPPHAQAVLQDMHAISAAWLTRPGRVERTFMMGYDSDAYLQQCRLAILRDATGTARGFMNLVPTYAAHTANYDMLRCDAEAPGNSNDYVLLGVIAYLQTQGTQRLNLGLSPLKGLDAPGPVRSLVDNTLGFVYGNGDKLYSFSGLERFKAKYEPTWESRFVAYPGTPAQFARVMTALTRAMKVK